MIRRIALVVGMMSLAVSSASAQSRKGTWQGTVVTGNASQPLIVVFDSTAAGWIGAATAPSTTTDSLKLVSISMRADTLEFGIPYNGSVVFISGLVAAEKFSGSMWINNSNIGSVELTRKAAAAARPPEKP